MPERLKVFRDRFRVHPLVFTPTALPRSYPLNATFAGTSTLLASSANKTVNLLEAVVQPVVQFSVASYTVQEDCTTLTITVNRVGDSSGAVSVDYNTSDGTATERKDYITALGTLQFGAGETSKTFVVLINEDPLVEGSETLNVHLGNPSGVALGAGHRDDYDRGRCNRASYKCS